MKRFQIIAPNGDECSAIWADNQIINKSVNKIEFKDGTIFAREPRLNKYRKIRKHLF